MSHRRVTFGFVVLTVLIFAVTIATIRAQTSAPPARRPSVPVGAVGGRFVMQSAFENFLWVLDSENGDVKGYRFVQSQDDSGTVTGFRVQNVPKAPDVK